MNKNKFKVIVDNIGFYLVIINLFIFNIIIGSNDKDLPIFNIAILFLFSIIILIVKKIVFKEKIVLKSKIDFAVLLFNGSLFLPILFRTYSSFEDSLKFFIKYQYVYSNYLLIRNFVNTKKRFNIVIVSTILFSLIVIIFGIDKQHSYVFKGIIEKLNLNYEKDERFSSTFGYVNAVTIYVTFCVLLALNRIENSKKIITKIVYILYVFLGFYVVYISLSRVVLLLLVMTLGLYVLLKIYSKIKNNKRIIYILIASVGISIIIGSLFITWALKYSKPYSPSDTFKFRKKFDPNTLYKLSFDISVQGGKDEEIDPIFIQSLVQERIRSDYNRLDNKDISEREFFSQNYKKYYQELSNNNLRLKIIEVNNYFIERELALVDIDGNGGKANVEIKTSNDVYYLKMEFENSNSKKITINKCYINGEEYAFAYKYLPRVIGRLISSFAYTDDSIVMRKQFYKTAIEISKKHFIIGNGGNAWQNLQQAYQDYLYNAKETHSYFFELLISYGIIGVIAFLVIVISLTKNVIKQIKQDKEIKTQKLLVLVGFCLLVGHSLLFDFNMSFIVIILTVFNYIALLQFGLNNNNLKKDNTKILSIIDILVIVVFIFGFIILVRANIAKYLIDDISIKTKVYSYNSNYMFNDLKEKSKNENVLKDLKKFINREPYYLQNAVSNLYWNQICSNIETLNEKELKYYTDFGVKQYKETEISNKMDFDFVLRRADIMANTINKLEKNDNDICKKTIEDLKEIIKIEYNKNVVNIEDNQRNNLTEEEMNIVKNKYDNILKSIE